MTTTTTAVTTMTDPATSGSEARMERLARLRQSRSASEPAGNVPQRSERPGRRRYPALGGRIAAAGLGTASMFALVAVFGLDNPMSGSDTQSGQSTSAPASGTPTPAAVPARPAPIKVIIYRTTRAAPVISAETRPDGPAVASPQAVGAETIELTANPVVRTVTVAAPAAPAAGTPAAQPAASAATTSGSR